VEKVEELDVIGTSRESMCARSGRARRRVMGASRARDDVATRATGAGSMRHGRWRAARVDHNAINARLWESIARTLY